MAIRPRDVGAAMADKSQSVLDILFNAAVAGIGPLKSAEESAQEALRNHPSPEEAVRALIRNHVALAGAQGFVTNLGGIITMPITLPANVSAAFILQIHLAAAIARVYGHDMDSEEVRTAVLLCLLGNAGAEALKQAGIQVGTKLTFTLLKKIPIDVIREINRRAGFMLIAKYRAKRSVVTLAKWVPLVGGIIGGGFDAASTAAVGSFARKLFRPSETGPDDPRVAIVVEPVTV